MRAVVTGGTGFIGSHSIASLKAAGHDVRLLVRSPEKLPRALAPHGLSEGDVEVVEGDITDPDAVKRALDGADAVLHGAAVFSLNPNDEQDDSAGNAGAAYFFRYDPTLNAGKGAWTQIQYIKSDSPQVGDNFGMDVDISADNLSLVVGASGYAQFKGAAYLFTRSNSSTEQWAFKTALVSSSTSALELSQMGAAVATDGVTVAAGAPGKNTNTGAVHIFERNASGVWVEVDILKPSDTTAQSFGTSIAIDGDTMLIGDPAGAGAAYVFRRDASGLWNESQKLTASNPDGSDRFGYRVAIEGDTLVVGAPQEGSGDPANEADNSLLSPGAAYVFTRDTTNNWSQEAYLKAAVPAAGMRFGNSVAIRNGNIAIGAPVGSGSAYVFSRTASGWENVGTLALSSSIRFGTSIGIAGNQVIVGEPGANTDGVTGSGAVHVFE